MAALLLVGGLAACSKGGKEEPSGTGSGDGSSSSSPSASPTPTNYLKVPKPVVLTPQGSQLEVGDTASVAWQLDAKRIAALDLKVARLRQVPISALGDWILDKKSKEATPYFVDVKVRNVGKAALGGVTVPLYADVGHNSLVSASSFESTFKACPSGPLPEKFKPGAKATMCWVYLAPDHGKLDGVTFYTGPGFNPITWTGTIEKVKEKKKGKA